MEPTKVICFDVPEGTENDRKRTMFVAECSKLPKSKWDGLIERYPEDYLGTSTFTGDKCEMTFSAVAIDVEGAVKVYVLTWRAELFELSSSTDETWNWRKIPGTARYPHGPEPPIAVLRGNIYACGGGWQEAKQFFENGCKTGRFSNKCEFFDVTKEIWIKASTLLQEIRRNSVITVDDFIYSVGGLERRNKPKAVVKFTEFEPIDEGIAVNAVERYNPVAQEWTPMDSLCKARVGPGLATCGGKIYALGGGPEDEVGQYMHSIEIYNIQANHWTMSKHQMRIARRLFKPEFIDGKIIIIGGEKDRRGTIEIISLKNIDRAVPETVPETEAENEAEPEVKDEEEGEDEYEPEEVTIYGADRIMGMATVFI